MNGSDREGFLEEMCQLVAGSGIEPGVFVERLEKMLDRLPDPERSRRNLLRFLETGFTSSLLHDFWSHPVLLSMFLELVGQSQYLADILVRNPEWLRWLTAGGALQRSKTESELRSEAEAALDPFAESAGKMESLKRFHRRELLRIGAQDILGEASLESIIAQLSALADVVIGETLKDAYQSVTGESIQVPGDMCVIALGKLGGAELNFSSDIDLLFVYENDSKLKRPVGRMQTAHEVSVRVAERTVDSLSGFSDEGHLYRVDMRLRPDGNSGPLAMSRSAYRTYYESRGVQWERQMLIKARCAGGDRAVGKRFLEDIRPFVYPRTLLTSPWENIASMKRAIEEGSGSEGDIKLGSGGIRDIEFLVQGLQLLHGGSIDELRTPNTLEALGTLSARGILPVREVDALREAYRLYRSIEHRLQLLHGLQTHRLPVEPIEFEILALAFGYSAAGFRKMLSRHRDHVRVSFRSATKKTDTVDDGRSDETETRIAALFSVIPDPKVKAAMVRDARNQAFPEVAANRMSVLLSRPDVRSVVLQALTSRRFRADLLRSMTLSRMVFERLTADPLLVETIVGQASDLLRRKTPGWSHLLRDDPARFKRYNEVRASIRFLTGRINVQKFEREVSAIAEAVVHDACVRTDLQEHVLVIGAGKIGTAEMGISSDLDLVLFFEEDALTQEEAQRIGREFSAAFISPEKSYDVDMRLRPEGRNAPLVAGLSYLAEYLQSRAEPWEALALKRSRPLWGSVRIRKQFEAACRKQRKFSGDELVTHLRTVRSKMEAERTSGTGTDLKLGRGGIADIDFIAQTGLLLRNRRGGRSTWTVLRSLGGEGLLRKRELHILSESLTVLRAVENVIRMNSQTASSSLIAGSDSARCAAAFLGDPSDEHFIGTLRRRMSSVRTIFDAVLSRWRSIA